MCLVTDRRRLAAAVGAGLADAPALVAEQVAGALDGGVDLIQVREPDLGAGALVEVVRYLIGQVPDSAGRLVVNDRLDVAVASGAGGVHLKESSFDPTTARRVVASGFLIGCSVHEPAGVARRLSADYFIAGTVRPTVSKAPGRYLGWEGLASIVRAAAGRPVLGIGGLGIDAVPSLVATGAAGLAAIGAFIPDGPTDIATFVAARATALRLAIDSALSGP